MYIFYIANARIPTQKAHGYQIVRMCHEYSKLGFDVELIISNRGKCAEKDIFSFYQLPRSFNVRRLRTLNAFRFRKIFGRLTFPFQSVVFFLRILFLSFPARPIIITRHPSIAWLMQKRGARVVYECHDWFGKGKRLALWFLRNVHLTVTTNGFIKEQFIKHGFKEEAIIIATNGVDLDTYALDISKEEALDALDIPSEIKSEMQNTFVALYTGSFTTMNTDKGIADILSALSHVSDDIYFVAVGGNEKDIAYYKNLAQEKSIDARAYFVGRVDQKMLAHFQRAADVLLMPFPRKAHYEYFMSPLKTFEYMASGRPIIASALPSIQEILDGKAAFFVPPEDPSALAEKIIFVKENQDDAQKHAKRAREKVQAYTWEKRAEKIAHAFST